MSEIASKAANETVDAAKLDMNADARALLDEAARLTGIDDPTELVQVALRELVERRRFQKWVAAHDAQRGCA